MRQRIFAYLLIVATIGGAFADTGQPPPKFSGDLQDPSAMNGKLEQTLEQVRTVAERPVHKRSDSSENNDLQDPTRMNQNFRDALNFSVQRQPSGGNASQAIQLQAPDIPDIRLIAHVFDKVKEKASVMLRVNGKSEMARMGEKITAASKTHIMTIEIIDIQKGFVTVKVLPLNETLILR